MVDSPLTPALNHTPGSAGVSPASLPPDCRRRDASAPRFKAGVRGEKAPSASKLNHHLAGFRWWKFLVPLLLSLTAGLNAASAPFRFTNTTDSSLALFEGVRPVFVYNHGIIHPPAGVPADRARATYVHPLYGLDGEVLTDDFPEDHFHHRGLFWAWPHVRICGKYHDLWMLKDIEQRFEHWVEREAGTNGATLGVENGWYVGGRKVMREQVWLRASPSGKDERVLDLELTWIPLEAPVTLEGAEGKSYGGLTLRFAPRTNTVITTPLGLSDKDLSITRLPWADLSARFAGRALSSGAAILVAPDHPDYPPEWLTRHYGVLCIG